jgi:hypothetical protein
MGNKYYYLVASLPYLRFSQASPISIEEFLLECGKWLGKNDMDILSEASIDDFTLQPENTPIIAVWKEFDFTLRKELALARDNIKYNRHEKPGPLAKIVLEKAHPLLMEQALERIRWDFLDSIEPGNFFDLNFLILYFLKVQILERLQMFDKEKGKKVFENMCEVEHV